MNLLKLQQDTKEPILQISQNELHMASKDIVIQGKQVRIGYRNRKQETVVHKDLNFSLYRGELTCLLGSNGSGKSTLLRTLSAIQPVLDGSIQLLGQPLSSYSEHARSRTIGVVLTEKTQAGGLSVYELVSLGRQPHTGFFGRLNAHDKAVIDYALQAVGIYPLRNKYIAELSDGERQKTFIAKALVQECPLILLDEPTAFLDVISRIEIMTLLRRLAKDENRAILLSTHDIDQALLLADRLWLLTRQKGLTCGVTEDLILSHEMESLFPQDNIYFNPMHGGYSPRTSFHRSICLEADNEILLHWTRNALNRIGYYCIEGEEANKNHSQLRLHAKSSQELILIQNDQAHTCVNFEQLLSELA